MQNTITSRRQTPRRYDNHFIVQTHRSISALENKLGKLGALIPVNKTCCPTYEHMLAKQILNLDLELIAAKPKQFLLHLPAAHLPALHRFEQHPPERNLFAPIILQLNDMAEILIERPRQVSNLDWQLGQPIGGLVNNFQQIIYIQFPNTVPDLDQALVIAKLDCERDLRKQLIEFGGANKL